MPLSWRNRLRGIFSLSLFLIVLFFPQQRCQADLSIALKDLDMVRKQNVVMRGTLTGLENRLSESIRGQISQHEPPEGLLFLLFLHLSSLISLISSHRAGV